ncbi:choline transporter-like protein 4 [Pagrus major]|uniref:choline transporter-like protein 4 n=1 Tax=Pagrus major TaxID=143350 RepID=UPI003CC8D27D
MLWRCALRLPSRVRVLDSVTDLLLFLGKLLVVRVVAAQNRCTCFLLCCLKCCFWCLEKSIKFLNKNTYIMIAIFGKNFCVSSKNAHMLLMRIVVRVRVLDSVTDLLLFLGKLLVVGLVGVLSFFFSGRILLPGNTFCSETLNYDWTPVITVMFGSYLIAHGFFSVYNMCVDTLFLCFLEDLERNDGSLQRPYFMSKNLMKILNKEPKTDQTDDHIPDSNASRQRHHCDPRHISVKERTCSPDIELIAIGPRPYYLPQEFTCVIVITVYILPFGNAEAAYDIIHAVTAGL